MSFKLRTVVAVCFILVSLAASASEQSQPKQYYDAASIVVGGEAQDFIIGQGENISIIAGQSIRLLPGTKIEAGGKVQIAVDANAKPETKEERYSVLMNPELPASLYIYDMECTLSAIPDPKKLILTAGIANAVMPVQVNNTSKNLPAGKIFHNLYSNNTALASNIYCSYLPILAWGERPETIKVLRT